MPRVAGKEMGDFTGKPVLLLAKVMSAGGDSGEVMCESADGTAVTVQAVAGAAPLAPGTWVQLRAKVDGPHRATEWTRSAANGEVNVENYVKLCEMWNGKYKSLFHPEP